MTINNTTYRSFVEKLGNTEPNEFVGEEGDLFWDPNTGEIRLSDGKTSGGINVSGGENLVSEEYVDNKVGVSTSGLASEAYVDSGDAVNAADIATVAADLQTEIVNRTNADVGITSTISAETVRAESAENTLDQKIDDLILDNLADVSVAGVSTGQAVTWGGTQWIAETITVPNALNFQGQINLTDYSTAPAVTSANAGDLYINITTGTVDNSYGTGVTNAITNVTGGEAVAVSGTGAWLYVGTVGANGLTYDNFSSVNVTETSESKGELAYNNSTGQYTFTKVDLDSRVPIDLSTLPSLPV